MTELGQKMQKVNDDRQWITGAKWLQKLIWPLAIWSSGKYKKLSLLLLFFK
jgi:hypothetical protein